MHVLEVVFGPKNHLLWWQECCRALLIFAYGLVIVRLAGRRSFSKWAALDIIVSILVGSNLSRALTGSADLWGTLAATTLILALHALLAQALRGTPCSPAYSKGSRCSLRPTSKQTTQR